MNFHKNSNREISSRSVSEEARLSRLREIHLDLVPKMGPNWNQHSLVTLSRQSLSRILHYVHLYEKILGVPGHVLEFGVQWGATLSQLVALRGILEPYNHRRKIIGFDTFSGLSKPSPENDLEAAQEGDYSTAEHYESLLMQILESHEEESPISHIRKFELVVGDASKTSKTWSMENKNTTVALAIFDMDLYHPTKEALANIIPHLTKGSILVFDELLAPQFPGEAQAVRELLELNKTKFHINPHQPNSAWVIWGE